MKPKLKYIGLSLLVGTVALVCAVSPAQTADKKPNVVMLMTDDTGWTDFGCYLGGAALIAGSLCRHG
jgi:arylsulfatase